MLTSRIDSFEGLKVADLFAGTGALGLEALSRGAALCVFVEQDPAALRTLADNVDRLGAGKRAQLCGRPVEQAPAPRDPFDLILMDPPYDEVPSAPLLERISSWLAPGGWLSLETHRARPELPPGLRPEVERRFGKATLLLAYRTGETVESDPIVP